MIHGEVDTCDPPTSSEGQDFCFSGGYRRVVFPGVGHFPAREAPEAVARAVLDHLRDTLRRTPELPGVACLSRLLMAGTSCGLCHYNRNFMT